MKPNVVAISVDADQFPPAAFLAKQLAAMNSRDDTEIVLFSDSLDDLTAARQFGVPAELQHLNFSFSLPAAEKRLTGAAFMRLFLPEVLGEEVKRILYLDADIYLESDALFRLFDLDMGQHAIGAVHDLVVRLAQPILIERTGVPPHQYLNSGVLLIDRRGFLDGDLRHRTVSDSAVTHFSVQNSLTKVLAGDWLQLSPAMNFAGSLLETFVGAALQPSIVHFMGPIKPWHGPFFKFHDRARRELEDFVLRSPWRSYLSKHYNFQTAWAELRQSGNGQSLSLAPWFPQGSESVAAYLRDTEFADVAQGITKLDRSAIP